MYLAAAHTLRIPPRELARRAQEGFGGELRRAGSFTQLSLLGVQLCRDDAGPAGSLGVLWTSSHGAVHAARAALDESRAGEPVMPFTFIATQPHLAAALLARHAPVARAAFVHVEPDAWPWLLHFARSWMGECDEVLVGWVEEADEGDDARSDWCLLRRRPAAVRCEPLDPDAADAAAAEPAASGEWIARLAAWRAAPRGALALRGGGEAWRFAAER